MTNIVSIKKLNKTYDNNFKALNNLSLDIKKGEIFTLENIWVKRPGTGEILAPEFNSLINKVSKVDIKVNTQITRAMFDA